MSFYDEEKKFPLPNLKKRLNGGRKTYISHRKEKDPIGRLSHGIRRLENRIIRYDVEQRRFMEPDLESDDLVKKRLQFTDDEDDFGFEFTDRIAALRSILKRPKVEYETEFSEEDLVSPKLLGIDSKKERNGFHKEGNMRERRNKEAKSMEQQVDDELAQMSYQNYEAMMHLDKYSDLLANVGDKMKKDSTHKSKPVQDNMEFVLNDNQKIETNSKFDDLDQVPQRDKATTCIYIHNYESVQKCQNCQCYCSDHSRCQNCSQNSSYLMRQGNLTCPKCNAPLLDNGVSFSNLLSSSQRSSKFIQSNVPHFDPIWALNENSNEHRIKGSRKNHESSHINKNGLKQKTSRKSNEKLHRIKHSADPGALTLDDLMEPPKSEKQRYNQKEKSKSRYSEERKNKSRGRKKLKDEFGSSDSSLKENFPNGRKIKGDESSSQKSKLSNSEEKRLKSKVEELFGLPNGVIDIQIPDHLKNSGLGVSEEMKKTKTPVLGSILKRAGPNSDTDGRYIALYLMSLFV